MFPSLGSGRDCPFLAGQSLQVADHGGVGRAAQVDQVLTRHYTDVNPSRLAKWLVRATTYQSTESTSKNWCTLELL